MDYQNTNMKEDCQLRHTSPLLLYDLVFKSLIDD